MTSAQQRLELDAPAAAATDRGDEAAWIVSERGLPLQTGSPRQVAGITALFGRSFAAVVPSEDEWRTTVLPEDLDRVVQQRAQDADAFDTTYRIVLPGGALRRVRDRVRVLGDRWRLRIVSAIDDAAQDDTATVVDRPAPSCDWLDVVLGEALLRCDHAGRIVETFGPSALLPIDAGTLIGRSIADFPALSIDLRLAWSTALDRALETQRAQICAYELDRGTGLRSFEARFMPLDAGAVAIAIADVGERNLLRERIDHSAQHDEVTGLGNARSLRDRLDAWMRPGVPVDRAGVIPVALLVVDLDRFKQSNELYGRSIGDSLLRLVAQRIRREALRELQGRVYDTHDSANPNAIDEHDDPRMAASLAVVRLGGDQFAVAWRIGERASLGAVDDGAARGVALADRLIAALGAPTRIAGQTLFVRASIGLALFPGDALTPSALFSQAEAALKRAKRSGRNQYRRHGDDAQPAPGASSRPPDNEGALRAAIASNQFLLVYQPKFELASSLLDRSAAGSERALVIPGAIVAVEALVRWRTPTGALLIPHEFVPLAESSGMIRPLGDWVLRTALAEVSRFAAQGAARVGVTINVSLLQLHDREFVRTVESALRESGFAAHELTVEIAETAFLEDIRLVADALAELSALGVRLAIDHFGVGTAGLVALKALPIDEIKIDRSFIAGAAIDAFDATIVSGLIEMAHNLGKTVTAEGVERVDQIASLSQMRCDAIQGYFVGEPLTADALVAHAALWRQTPGAPS